MMRYGRWIGLAGAVIYTAGFFLVSSAPGGGEVETADFEEFYVEDERTVVPILGVFALTIGALALLWFFHSLRAAIATSDAGLGWAATALGLAIVLTGGSLLAAPSGVQAFSDADFVGAPVAHTLAQAGFGAMLVPGSLCLGFGIAVLSLAGRKAGVVAPWVAVAGVVVAVLQLAAVVWLPSLLIPLWVLAAAAAGVRTEDRASALA